MIRDLVQDAPNASDSADVCIVGAGAAGIVLAVELTWQGKRVVVLEGGGRDVEEESQETYRSEIAGLRHNAVHIGGLHADNFFGADGAYDNTARVWLLEHPGSAEPTAVAGLAGERI